MKIFGKISLIVSLFLLSGVLYAHEMVYNFSSISYSDQDGLPTNLIKDVVCDSTGFIWIASDEGLVRYNGNKFEPFSKGLQSLYTKKLLVLNRDSILVVNDFGLGVLTNLTGAIEDVKYSSVIHGDLEENDTTTHFPKNVFVDSQGRIWIAEIRRLTIIDNGEIRKVNLPEEYASDSFAHSFYFAEYNGTIYIMAWRGFILKYEEETHSVKRMFSLGAYEYILNGLVNKNNLYLATSKGVREFNLDKPDKAKLISEVGYTTTIHKIDSDHLLATVWMKGIYYIDLETGRYRKSLLDITTARTVSPDNYGTLWLASDDGVYLLSKSRFSSIPNPKSKDNQSFPFVNIVSSDNNQIFFADFHSVYQLKQNDENVFDTDRISRNDGELIHAIGYHNDMLAVSYLSGRLEIYKNNKLIIEEKRFIHDRLSFVDFDDSGNLWGIKATDASIIKYNVNSKTYRSYYLYLDRFEVTLLKIINGNEIFVAVSKNHADVYAFNKANDRFEKTNMRVTPENVSRLIIYDIAKTENDNYLLATSRSVFRFNGKSVERVNNFEQYNFPITKSIAVENDSVYYVGTDRGIFGYYNGDITHFNVNDGLKNSTISIRGLVFDNDKRLYVGTAEGISFQIKGSTRDYITPRPFIYGVKFSRFLKDRLVEEKNLYSGVTLEAEFTSFFYPTEKILYKHVLRGLDEELRNSGRVQRITYHNLDAGNYTLEVYAKKDGYQWSNPSYYNFTVVDRWYARGYMVWIYLVLSLFTIAVIVQLWSKYSLRRVIKNREELSKLVRQRTKDLAKEKERVEELLKESEIQREELRELNEFRGELLHISAHDLKNPLQSILGLESILKEDENLKGDAKEAVDIVYDASRRMHNIILEVLENEFNRTSDLKMKFERYNMAELVQDIIHLYKIPTERKNQNIITDIELHVYAEIDVLWIKNTMENLLSNAVKYSPKNKNIWIKLYQEEDSVIIKIKDEGPGFTEDDKKKMFNKFEKLSARPTGNETSTGLGLFIVKNILNKHNGTITLETEEGKGSEFTVKLPKKQG